MNTQIHETTKCSPYEVVFGQKPRDVVFPSEKLLILEEDLEFDGVDFESSFIEEPEVLLELNSANLPDPEQTRCQIDERPIPKPRKQLQPAIPFETYNVPIPKPRKMRKIQLPPINDDPTQIQIPQFTNEPPVTDTELHTPVTNEPLHSPVTDEPLHTPVTDEPLHTPVTDEPLHTPVTDEPLHSPATDEPLHTPVTDDPVLTQLSTRHTHLKVSTTLIVFAVLTLFSTLDSP